MLAAKRPDSTDPFAAVMGACRGLGTRSLAAADPNERAVAEADALIAAAATGDVQPAIRELNRHGRDDHTAPLLGRIADAAASALHDELLRRLAGPLAWLQLSPHVEPRVIRDEPPTLHLWPDGGYLNTVDVAIAACERHVDTLDATHARRGDWWQATESTGDAEPYCPGCARHARRFPETTERPEPVLARELLVRLPSSLLGQMRASVAELASAGRLDAETAWQAHAGAYRRRLAAAAVKQLQADREVALMRMLYRYPEWRQRAGKDVSAVLRRVDWQFVVDRAFAPELEGVAAALAVVSVTQALTEVLGERLR